MWQDEKEMSGSKYSPDIHKESLRKDMDERLCFLRSFILLLEDEVRGVGGRMLLFLKNFLHRGATKQSLLGGLIPTKGVMVKEG